MSKCRPKGGIQLMSLYDKGVTLEDSTVISGENPHRTVVIRIPYDALLRDPEVQSLFQGLVAISSEEPPAAPQR